MKDHINSHFTPWKVGDKVWLDNKNLKLCYQSKKLASKREGPFKIEQVLSPSSYKLHLPPTRKMHPIFHASLLSTYLETKEHSPNFLSPPPSLIHGAEEYTVKTIIAHCSSAAHQQFHVRWEGYPLLEDTWELLSHLAHTKYLVRAYKAHHPNVFASSGSP